MIFKLSDDVNKLERQVNDLESKDDTKELERYYEFFNAETLAIAELVKDGNMQALIDRNTKYRDILFETRVKAKATVRAMQTILQNMDENQRKEYQEYEVSAYTTNLDSKTPFAKADKKGKQKKDAIAALQALGLDGDALIRAANKFGIGKKADELKAKHEESVASIKAIETEEKKESDVIKKETIATNTAKAKTSFMNAFKK